MGLLEKLILLHVILGTFWLSPPDVLFNLALGKLQQKSHTWAAAGSLRYGSEFTLDLLTAEELTHSMEGGLG